MFEKYKCYETCDITTNVIILQQTVIEMDKRHEKDLGRNDKPETVPESEYHPNEDVPQEDSIECETHTPVANAPQKEEEFRQTLAPPDNDLKPASRSLPEKIKDKVFPNSKKDSETGLNLSYIRATIFGIILNRIALPVFKRYIDQELRWAWESIKKDGSSTLPLKYKMNEKEHNVFTHHDLAKHYLGADYMKKFDTVLDESFEATPALNIMAFSPCFKNDLKLNKDAKALREMRNKWAHFKSGNWTLDQFNVCVLKVKNVLAKLETRLLTKEQLNTLLAEIEEWEKDGLERFLLAKYNEDVSAVITMQTELLKEEKQAVETAILQETQKCRDELLRYIKEMMTTSEKHSRDIKVLQDRVEQHDKQLRSLEVQTRKQLESIQNAIDTINEFKENFALEKEELQTKMDYNSNSVKNVLNDILSFNSKKEKLEESS